MSTSVQPRLAHCGIYVSDVERQVQFYERVLGMVVSDRGVSRTGSEFAFMTAGSDHHHQIVFISGRAPENPSTVNQISFKVGNIGELQAMFQRARKAGVDVKRQINHGNALSFYFPDPEGNGLEVYMDTPWYVPQPHGEPIDLSLPADRLMMEAEQHCRATPGFMTHDAWQAQIKGRLQLAQ
jgi:catechol 2,3-dioxygenase